MFGWFKKDKVHELESETRRSFTAVKDDIDAIGKWIKHLDSQDKQVLNALNSIKKDMQGLRNEMNNIRYNTDRMGEELNYVREQTNEQSEAVENEHLLKKLPVFDRQTDDEVVQRAVQIAVQTDNVYDILKKLSSNERLLVYTLLNSDMKLSYEDLALLLGKEKSTIRGQINMIKQKCEGLLEERVEKSGKKRVFIPEDLRQKLQKYAKVRVGKKAEGKNER